MGRAQRADQRKLVARETRGLIGNLRIDGPAGNGKRGHKSSRAPWQVAHTRIEHYGEIYSESRSSITSHRVPSKLLEQEGVASRFFDDRFDEAVSGRNLRTKQSADHLSRFIAGQGVHAQFLTGFGAGMFEQRPQKLF